MPSPNVSLAGMKENPEMTEPSIVNNIEDGSLIELSEEELSQRRSDLQALNNLAENPKYVEANTLLPGIYGYVEDPTTGEKITLSLTPYEISPRLADSRIYKPTGEFSSGLTTAMTVANRLQSSRVFTNFMQEVLPPEGEDGNTNTDIRFSSKDDRIGGMSRFLSADGLEADKSTFLHIVPDMDSTGGKLEIAYAKYDDKGNRLEKNEIAYLPVNFNFISSKYSLTIKEFIIENVQEASREIYSLNKSFDGYTLRLFGQHPQIMSFSGSLTNFDDDVIGIDSDLLRNIGYLGEELSGSQYLAPRRGSQRDAFLTYYENFLAGTKCRDYSMKVFFYYNHRIMEGYLIEMSMSSDSSNDNVVRFGGNMIIRRKYSTFETGSGFAGNIPSTLRNINYSGSGFNLDNTIFDSKKSYRNNYREYAINQSKKLLSLAGSQVKDNTSYTIDSEKYPTPGSDISADWIKNSDKFINTDGSTDKTNLTDFIRVIINKTAELTASNPSGLDTNDKKNEAVKNTYDYIFNQPAVSYTNFVVWLFSNTNKGFYLYGSQSGNDAALFSALLQNYPESSITDFNQASKPYDQEAMSKLFRACYQKFYDEKDFSISK